MYCAWSDVLNYTGFDSDRIIELSIRHSNAAQVQALIEEFIKDATAEINSLLGINTTIRKEIHLGTGEDDVFTLGQEDEEGAYYHNIADRLIDVIHVWMCGHTGSYRKLRPYPTNCELGTDLADPNVSATGDWSDSTVGGGVAVSTTRMAGSYSVQLTYMAAAQYARFPDITNDVWIDKNIDIFSFMAFYVNATAACTLTIRLYDVGGNYNEATYTLAKKNHWYLVMLDLDEDFTTTVDWDDKPLMYFDILQDQAVGCTVLIDNLNFNDGWMFTAPVGEVAIMRKSTSEPIEQGYPFYVTYRYNPYLDVDTMVARNIKKATACLAGMDLVDFLRGIRVEETEMDVQSESGVTTPTKDALANTRRSLERKYDRAIASIGYGWEFIPVKDLNVRDG